MRSSLMLVLLTCNACNNGCAVYYDPNAPIPVADTGPSWVHTALHSAVDSWAQHGVQMVPQETGIPIIVGFGDLDVPPRAVGVYRSNGRVFLSETLIDKPALAACVLTHELGHSMGMNHLAPGALMSIDSYFQDGVCLWSAADDQELVRVGKY